MKTKVHFLLVLHSLGYNLTILRNAQVLRQELWCLLEKGAVERVPPSELKIGFYSRYFVVPKRYGGLRPILDLRPITERFANCSGDWFVFMDLKDAYFHIRIPPHHRCYLRFASRAQRTNTLFSIRQALAPRTFQSAWMQHLFPHQSERDAHSQLS